MNMDCFLKRFSQVLMTNDNDATFEAFKIWVGGTTSPKIAKLLNFAVSQMDADECYVETGVFTGCTLISAHYANGKTCIGIDPYGPGMKEATLHDAAIIRDQAKWNIARLAAESRLIEKDFRDVKPEEIEKKIAVSMIDAKHNYPEVWDNLVWLEPLLADDALIFFDDINYEGVSAAILDWLKAKPENYQLTAYIKPFYQDGKYVSSVTERVLNNGFALIRYHKNPKAVGVVSLVDNP